MTEYEKTPATLKKRGEPVCAVAEAVPWVEPVVLARWEGEGGATVPDSALRTKGEEGPIIRTGKSNATG